MATNLNMNKLFDPEKLSKLSLMDKELLSLCVEKHLEDHGSFDIDKILRFSLFFNINVAKFLIDNGATVNKQSAVIHGLIHDNKIEAIKLALSCGVDINHKDKEGLTALHVACYVGNKQVAHLLLENNANIEEEDIEGNTSIMMTVKGGNCQLDMFKFMLEHGANVAHENKKWMNVYKIAFVNNFDEVIHLLTNHYQESYLSSKSLEKTIQQTPDSLNSLSF